MTSFVRVAVAVILIALAETPPLIPGDGDRFSVINSPAPDTDGHAQLPDGYEVFPVTADQMYVVSNEGNGIAGSNEKIIYDNPLGQFAVTFPAGQIVADDLTFSVQPGCPLSRYRFRVIGKTNPLACGGLGETCGPLRIDFGLFSECPGAVVVPIEGTSGCASTEPGSGCILLPDADAISEIIFTPSTSVSLPSAVWLGVTMSRGNGGVIVGAPALNGFSDDVLDVLGFACASDLGRFPARPHASFNATVYGDDYGDDTCENAFLTYQNTRAGNGGFTEGANVCIAEDIKLNRTCDMSQMEIAVRGAGRYDVELRRQAAGGAPQGFCNAITAFGPDAIPGTRFAFAHQLSTLRVFRRAFDPPIPLPDDDLLAVMMGNNDNSTFVWTRRDASVGSTLGTYWVFDGTATGGTWNLTDRTDGGVAATTGIHIAITCAGEPPIGACCDSFFPDADNEAVCREVPEINCPFPPQGSSLQPAWQEGDACDPHPFPFACGTGACCVLDEGCEDLTANECASKEPIDAPRQWQLGQVCGEGGQHCPLGECAAVRSGPGCRDGECELSVCGVDSWCCAVEWDELCVRRYERFCESVPRNSWCSRFSGLEPTQARSIDADSTTVISNSFADDTLSSVPQPVGFSCFERTERRCVGGQLPGAPCSDDSVCNQLGEGTCEDVAIAPELQGEGVLWFRFTATATSAHIHTCDTLEPVTDTILEVYGVQDDSSPSAACDTLFPVGCHDEASACANNTSLAGLCVPNLVIGETYYIKVAGITDLDRGIIVLRVEPTCLEGELHAAPTSPMLSALVGTDAPSSPGRFVATETGILNAGDQDISTWDQGEVPYDPPVAKPIDRPAGVVSHAGSVERDGFVSVQVNVDALGNNIVGDAANEPSIAVDPGNRSRIVIAWRQFDTIASNFRQAGWGYSSDGGQTWTSPGVLEPNVFRSDPVLAASSEGIFYYYSLTGDFTYDLFTSFDGGVTWPRSVPAFGGDKGWMIVDTTGGRGHGNIYAQWTAFSGEPTFARSTDGGASFGDTASRTRQWGTLAVGLDDEVYSVSADGVLTVSQNAWDPEENPSFTFLSSSGTGGGSAFVPASPNPGGLLGQGWIAVDHSSRMSRGNVYVVTTSRSFAEGGSRVMFARSEDRGQTWAPSRRIEDVPVGEGTWQWFGTMDVAPNGRIDVIWNDTRNSGLANLSELFYSSSDDGGESWSAGVPVSPMFDSHVGWPNQAKLGDYYHMVSDDQGAAIAYAATFNGEQDVYFLRIGPPINDCNENGFPDPDDVAQGRSLDCDGDGLPDECEPDFDGDGLIDDCDPDRDNDGIGNEFDVCGRSGPGVGVTDEGRPRGDTTHDCDLNLSDYWRFRNCLVDGRPSLPPPRDACLAAFDYDEDGAFTLGDFAVFQNGFEASSR